MDDFIYNLKQTAIIDDSAADDVNEIVSILEKTDENTKRKFFHNLSERLAVMLAEDMIVRGDVRITDVVKAVQKILVVILKLMSTGEVADTGFAFYDKMMDIFEIDKPSPNQIDYDMAVAELRALHIILMNTVHCPHVNMVNKGIR